MADSRKWVCHPAQLPHSIPCKCLSRCREGPESNHPAQQPHSITQCRCQSPRGVSHHMDIYCQPNSTATAPTRPRLHHPAFSQLAPLELLRQHSTQGQSSLRYATLHYGAGTGSPGAIFTPQLCPAKPSKQLHTPVCQLHRPRLEHSTWHLLPA